MMFDYPAYGYTRDLLLMVTIQPPADAVPKKVSIGLQASWMACGSSCHPGNHRFALALPGEASTSPKASPTASVFEAARKELPVPLQGWSVRVESAVDAAEIRIRLRALESGGRSEVAPETCTFFSSDGQVSSRPPQRWSRASDGSLVMVAFRSEYGPKGRSSLPGVLYCSGGWGPQGTPQYMRVQPPVAATK